MSDNRILLPKTSRTKFSKKSVGKAIFATGILFCAAIGLSFWKFAVSDRREYNLDLENGSTLIISAPPDWTLDKFADDQYKEFSKKTKPDRKEIVAFLPLQHNEANGFRTWLIGFLQRNVFVPPTSQTMQIVCSTFPADGGRDPESLRSKDLVEIQLNNRKYGVLIGQPIQLSREDFHDSGLWLRQTSATPFNGQKLMGKLLSQKKLCGINVYRYSQDGKQSIKISAYMSYPVELQGVLASSIDDLATHLRIVKTEALNR